MRPILHVAIFDDVTGDELADVDAASTADGLAYFLRSRHIDDDATELDVLDAAGIPFATGDEWRREMIVREERQPITGALERALVAKISAR